jgi:hypothetical protein
VPTRNINSTEAARAGLSHSGFVKLRKMTGPNTLQRPDLLYTGVMKKFLTVLVALGLVMGTVTPTFAQNGGKHGKHGGHKGGSRGGPQK